MPIKRPPTESQPRPSVVDLRARPPKAVDVLQAVEAEPESESLFDPKVDISKDSEASMFITLNKYRNKDCRFFSIIAMNLSILYPDRKANLKLCEREFNGMKVGLDDYRNAYWWFEFSGLAMCLSILYPDRKAELKLGEREFNGMKAKLDEYRNKDWLDFSIMAMNLSILYPDRKAELGLGESEFNGMKAKLDEYRNDYWLYFSNMAIRLSILYPDRKAELKLGEREFNGMKAKLDEYRRKNDWRNFSNMAMCLSILSADCSEITANGQIRLTHKKEDLVKKARPLPIVPRV